MLAKARVGYASPSLLPSPRPRQLTVVIFRRDKMPQSFDFRLGDLTGARPETPDDAHASASSPGDSRTFYIETFGCQMNVHDSEKVAGVLLGRGYRQAESLDAAKLVFYNTCSIREKAAHKGFSRLGDFRKRPDSGKIIGVLGCVAQIG